MFSLTDVPTPYLVAIFTLGTSVGIALAFSNKPIKMTTPVMDLQPIQAPRLTGTGLSMFASLVRTPILGKIILKKLKKDNQFHHVREFANSLQDVMPLYFPVHIPSQEQVKQHKELATNFSLEQVANIGVDENKNEFHRWTIHDYTSQYRSRAVTPLQVLTAVLDSIEASNARSPPLLAVIKCHREQVLEEAKASTERYARGEPLGVLDGVPIAVKDELEVIGYTTSYGTSFLGELGGVATQDAGPVARLRRAGAIIVGKTNMHEVGVGTFGINLHDGTPRNPYNDQYMTGGSSSGSAALVASGLVPLAVGCDGGGSIRIPAGLCGVVGLKATFMRIPFHFQGGPSVANVGPIAATVQDVALAYAIMSGADPQLPQSIHQPPVFVLPKSSSLASLRVGVFPAYVEGCDPAIFQGYQDTIAFFKSQGATIVEVEIPHLQALHLSHSITILTELSQHLQTHPLHLFTPDTQVALAIGQQTMESADFLAAQKVRSYAKKAIEALFEQVDVFLTPTTASLAPRLEPDMFSAGLSQLSLTTALMRFIVLGNMVGIPGLSVPVGFAPENQLPISMLLQAAHWNEHQLIDIARHLEAHFPTKEPAIYYSILSAASSS